MTTDIASGGTSNFLATKKYFRANHTTAKERVVVFVEDEIDSVFWRQFFDKYGTDKIYEIKVLRCPNNELCGKDALVKYIQLDTLGPNKLIAIDADYDYILDNYHPYTEELRNCKFVVHTYDTYAIENCKITAKLLKESIYLTSFCEYITEDIETMIKEVSQLYFTLFVLHLFSTNKKDRVYKQAKFKSDLHKLSFKRDKISSTTKEHISNRVKEYDNYIQINQEDYESFLSYINSLGINENNCWQYFNGHDAFEEIGIKIATNLSCYYRGKYFEWLSAKVSNIKQRENLLKKFDNLTRVNQSTHQLKDRIAEILYDIKPDMTWEPSLKIDEHIRSIIM